MINLNLIPNVNAIDAQEKNANGGLMAQLIMFYIGVAAFVLVCCIPPFTLFLPFMIPLIVLIVIFCSKYEHLVLYYIENICYIYISGVLLSKI